uniref:Uncharacterized protein n=1 Tax=Plectus sambesii TaxID=2011161 RepID=A0A914WLH5_9BILA
MPGARLICVNERMNHRRRRPIRPPNGEDGRGGAGGVRPGVASEVHAIADDLTERLAKQGDKWLHASSSKPKYFEFTPIELWALTERLKLAVPTAGVGA